MWFFFDIKKINKKICVKTDTKFDTKFDTKKIGKSKIQQV